MVIMKKGEDSFLSTGNSLITYVNNILTDSTIHMIIDKDFANYTAYDFLQSSSDYIGS